jgi:DNA-binding NtrC family response regulator
MPAVQERPKTEQLRSTLPICVLDDETDQVELTTTSPKRAGFPAYGTTNPAEALQKVRAGDRDLRAEVLAGRFREDLFYRLSSIEIRVPGLGERQEDIPVLVQHFLKKYSVAYGKPLQGLTRRAHIALPQHDWPGNVRELENLIAGAAITASAELIDISDFPEHLQKAHRRSASASAPWTPLPLDEPAKRSYPEVLDMCHGNRVRTTQVLGIGQTSLYRFLKRAPKHAAAKGAA